jgi:hypothetical protein
MMAADLFDQDRSSATAGREPWQTPRVIRFGAAEAGAGDTVSSADGSTDKS